MSAASPCTGLCVLGPDDAVCRGCLRSAGEIAAWAGAGEAARQAVLRRLRAVQDRAVRAVLPDSEIESLGGTPAAAVGRLEAAAARAQAPPPLALACDEAHLLMRIRAEAVHLSIASLEEPP